MKRIISALLSAVLVLALFCIGAPALRAEAEAFAGYPSLKELFDDLDYSQGYVKDMYFLGAQNMVGVADRKFGPELQLTRAMLIQLLYCISGDFASEDMLVIEDFLLQNNMTYRNYTGKKFSDVSYKTYEKNG